MAPLKVVWSELGLRALKVNQVAQGFYSVMFWKSSEMESVQPFWAGQLCWSLTTKNHWLTISITALPRKTYIQSELHLLHIVTIVSCPLAMKTWEKPGSFSSAILFWAVRHNSQPSLEPCSLNSVNLALLASRCMPCAAAQCPWLNTCGLLSFLRFL